MMSKTAEHRNGMGAGASVSLAAASAGALLGLAVLAGWHTHNVTLVQVLPAFAPMQYNTALCFLLVGLGLLAAVFGRPTLTGLCGALAGAVGALTLTEYVLGVDAGLDQLFMDHYITVKTSHPGRMAPNTALCFTLSGVALLAMRFRVRASVGGMLGASVIALGTLAFFGYVNDVETAYGWGRLTRMALHSSLGLIVVGTGISVHAWREELRWDLVLIAVLGVVLPLVGIVVTELYFSGWFGEFRELHSAIEAGGAGIALSLAVLLLLRRGEQENRVHRILPACGLLVLGIGDGIHAMLAPSDAFVWLRSFATFEAGLLFATLWLPLERLMPQRLSRLPLWIGAAALAGALSNVLFPDLLPAMASTGGELSRVAKTLHVGGGILFILGAAHFINAYRLERDPHDSVFAVFCLLFGAAGLLAETSRLWDAQWWLWHVIRFGAYVIAFGYLYALTRWTQIELRETNSALQKNVGELLETQNALRESAQMYHTVVDAETELICRFRPDGTLTFVNQAYCRYFGLAHQELVGRTFFDFLPPDGQRDMEALLQRLESNPRTETHEHKVMLPSGEERWHEWNNTAIFEEHGQVTEIQGVGRDVTARHEVQEALRVSEERLNLALKSSGVGTWDCDVEAGTIIADDYVHDLLGLEAGSFGGTYRALVDLVYEEDRPKLEGVVSAALREKTEYDTEYRVRWPDGRIRHLASRGKVYRDAGGRAVRLAGVSWDISDEKQAQAALQESEERLQSVLDNSPNMVYMKDLDGRYLLVNRKFMKVCGKEESQVLGKTAREVWPERIADAFSEYHRQVIDSGETVRFEETIPSPEGARVYFAAKFPLLGFGGQIYAVASIATDITERKRAEEALSASHSMVQAVLNTIPVRVFWKDRDLNFLGCNAPFAQDAGLDSPDDLVGKSDFDMVWSADADKFRADDRSVMTTGEAVLHFKESRKNPDGTLSWLVVSKVPLEDGNGNVTGVLGTYEDVTKQREAEESLRHHSEQLARLNTELQRTNQELDQFAYVASHDLQEPLRTLVTYTGFLEEDLGGELSDEAQQDFQLLAGAATRMQQLVQDLLAFSRSGRHELNKACLPLGDCVDVALANLESLLEEGQVEIASDALPVLEADQTLLTQVFQNLITNAVKFQKDGKPRVHITAEQEGDVWTLGVADNGIGVEPQYQEQIFTPFKRLHTVREYEGSGIGLSICRKIVERHGGRIWVESEPGQGSHFKFTLGQQ